MAMPNRLAEEGENLVTHRFSTGTLGLASPSDFCSLAEPVQARARGFRSTLKGLFNAPQTKPVPAVCIPPGARLMLQDIPAYLQRYLKVGSVEEVTFTQLTAAVNTYRDAIRFKNGRDICLQELQAGQRVRVLDLSSAEAFEPVREEQRALQVRLR
jgi:hypothetical protein